MPKKITTKTKALAPKKLKEPQNLQKAMWTKEQIKLITRTVAKGATMDELSLFLYTANKLGLDPLAKQIHFTKFKLKDGSEQMAVITGIDGYRAIAERTGELAGMDDIVYDKDIEYDGKTEPRNPTTATATVYRMVKDQRVAFTATARWREYYPDNPRKRFMWNKMPYLMLGKVAEALALRRAFPQDLSGVKIAEEMDQAGEVITNTNDKTTTKKKTTKKTPQKSTKNSKKEDKKVVEAEVVEEEKYYCCGCDIEITKSDYEISTKLSQDGKPYCQECLKEYRK